MGGWLSACLSQLRCITGQLLHPIQGEIEILLIADATKVVDKCRSDGPLGSYVHFNNARWRSGGITRGRRRGNANTLSSFSRLKETVFFRRKCRNIVVTIGIDL